ncbi:MAG: glutamine-hydrolyzing GMP synthase [Candidatus Omnitrophota bacterium]
MTKKLSKKLKWTKQKKMMKKKKTAKNLHAKIKKPSRRRIQHLTLGRSRKPHNKRFIRGVIRRRINSTRFKFQSKPLKTRQKDIILILDFGSQYSQLIARRIRENKVFSKIVPWNISIDEINRINPRGLIFSGGPQSVYDKDAPLPDKDIFKLKKPILGICYGMQVLAHMLGGKVKPTTDREYGRAELFIDYNRQVFENCPSNITCWMSHGDEIKKLPQGFRLIAHTLNNPVAAIGNTSKKIYGLQFHPEVVHTQRGNQILANFLFSVCGCLPRWTMDKFIHESIRSLRETIGNKKIVLGLSGGVDSSVAAMLIHRAIGRKLFCILVDNGLLRKNEAASVQRTFKGHFKMNLTCVNAEKRFLQRLKNVTDPEQKRKIIGDEFVKVFQEASKRIKGVEFLGQGTLYPDVIESISPIGGPSATIKTHHNVGGLPKTLKLKLVEPLRDLFKDEVRKIGAVLGLTDSILKRQPFPGPGLAVRIVGEVTPERLSILREADERVLEEIRKAGLYEEIWQSFAVLLPIKTVGVMGDKRTYENAIALRCVTSSDGMTADWVRLPPDLLSTIANRIINEVPGVNRVVYDISSKPPSTIEWE